MNEVLMMEERYISRAKEGILCSLDCSVLTSNFPYIKAVKNKGLFMTEVYQTDTVPDPNRQLLPQLPLRWGSHGVDSQILFW